MRINPVNINFRSENKPERKGLKSFCCYDSGFDRKKYNANLFDSITLFSMLTIAPFIAKRIKKESKY